MAGVGVAAHGPAGHPPGVLRGGPGHEAGSVVVRAVLVGSAVVAVHEVGPWWRRAVLGVRCSCVCCAVCVFVPVFCACVHNLFVIVLLS